MQTCASSQSQRNKLLVVLAITGAAGVALGAFGSHALREVLDERLMEVWRTAVFYWFVHTLAGIFWEARLPRRGIGFVFLLGIALFSGSLFLLCLTGVRWLGAITPFGGVTLIGAWLFAAWLELGGRSATKTEALKEQGDDHG